MSARVQRIERIVELRSRAVNVAAAALAEARRAAEAAAAIVVERERAYAEAVDAAAGQRAGTIAEFGERRAFAESLRDRLERARLDVRQAEAVCEEKQRVLAEAKKELRKIELWRDGMKERERVEEDRQERVGADELAARIARREVGP
jgi:flagellar export protein FliJ